MRVHYINVQQADSGETAGRNSSGGCPVLSEHQEWPKCRLCKADMILFFQFDIRKEFDLPLKPGSHLLVFMCPIHNDAPMEVVPPSDVALPGGYWSRDFGHYKLLLNKNPKDEKVLSCETHIKPAKLIFREEDEDIDWDGKIEIGTPGFKVGGVPAWVETPELHHCSCGAEMVFVTQIPQGALFPRSKGAPLQPDSQHIDGYNIFMGKSAYIFACKEQCAPEALYAVAQEAEKTVEQMTA